MHPIVVVDGKTLLYAHYVGPHRPRIRVAYQAQQPLSADHVEEIRVRPLGEIATEAA